MNQTSTTQALYSPHHYCSICNAESVYAPQPNGSFPKFHTYLCGSTQLYLESGIQVFTGHGQQISIYTKIPGDTL